jgi:hypothetical protein
LFDSGSQFYLISKTLIDDLSLETYDLVQRCSLGQVQEKYAMRITMRCKDMLSINVGYLDELGCEVSPLDACEVMSDNPY